MSMEEFSNKVVVITGGSSGIGLSIAQKFDRAGAKLAILGRNEQKLSQTAKSLKNILTFQGDVCKISDLDRFYTEIQSKFGKIDILIGSAGIAETRPIHEVDEKFFDEMVHINYKGLFFTVQRSLPYLNRNAVIILISSAAAHIGWPGHSVYSSTKAAVSHLARNFCADLIDNGIRVNAISPGFVDTPLFDDLKASSPETMHTLKNIIPAKRFALADEIAEAALFLASPRSSYIVGADLVIDGGLSAIFPFKG
jgi:NAD(P)-dependent dehydrogenase (short-subunit alcohol dehydrogenase family)